MILPVTLNFELQHKKWVKMAKKGWSLRLKNTFLGNSTIIQPKMDFGFILKIGYLKKN
jgi:hypothetical protein